MAIITYLDENDFRKKERSLRKYFMKNYKYLIFDFYPKLRKEGKKEGKYEVELPVDTLFEKTYGKMKLLFSVKKDIAVLEDIQPTAILLEGNKRELPTYKGVPYSSQAELKKLKIVEGLCQKNN